jgi:regulator of nucleoside diphosphate kinase
MTHASKPSARPPILLSDTDAERLSALALQHEGINAAADLLLDELERARVVPEAKAPADVIGMNAMVSFVDEAHGQPRTIQLVYPTDADIEAGKVSILTPVGAGLIGLRTGQAILWPDRNGERRTLRILEVKRAAPAVGR